MFCPTCCHLFIAFNFTSCLFFLLDSSKSRKAGSQPDLVLIDQPPSVARRPWVPTPGTPTGPACRPWPSAGCWPPWGLCGWLSPWCWSPPRSTCCRFPPWPSCRFSPPGFSCCRHPPGFSCCWCPPWSSRCGYPPWSCCCGNQPGSIWCGHCCWISWSSHLTPKQPSSYGNIGTGSKLLLRSTPNLARAVRTETPVIPAHVSPLEDAVRALQSRRKLNAGWELSSASPNVVFCPTTTRGSWCAQQMSVQTSLRDRRSGVVLSGRWKHSACSCYLRAEAELKVALVVGSDFCCHTDPLTRPVLLDNQTLAIPRSRICQVYF